MDISIDIRMMWPLVSQEAMAGGASEVEPGHILCGALKIAEVPQAAIQNALQDKNIVAAFAKDQQRLCETLEDMGIRVPDGSTQLRRGLRGLLRKSSRGKAEASDGVMHRSVESRTLFEKATDKARKAGDLELTARCLIETILCEPDEGLAKALAKMKIHIDARPAPNKAALAWIDTCGVDLTTQARETGPDTARLERIKRDAVCRVLAEALFPASEKKSPPVLLISKGERQAASAVKDLAFWLVSSTPPAGVRQGCILEIQSAAILNNRAEGSPESRIEDVFRQAENSRTTALFFDDFHRYLIPSIAGKGLPNSFQSLLKEGKTNCVVGMMQKQYETHLEKAAVWRNVFRLIWLHDTATRFEL